MQFPPNFGSSERSKPLDTKDTKTISTQDQARSRSRNFKEPTTKTKNLSDPKIRKPFRSNDFGGKPCLREIANLDLSRQWTPPAPTNEDISKQFCQRCNTQPIASTFNLTTGVFSCGWFLGGEPPYLRASTSRAKQRTTLDNT